MSDGRDSINESLQKRAKVHRLPTLQPVRDLTLGAKKVFVPNLNAKKPKESEAPKQEAKKERSDKVRKKREPRGPRDKKSFQKKEYVQSYSIFADGAAATSNLARDAKGVRLADADGAGGPRGIRLGGPKAAGGSGGGGGVSGVSDGLGKLSVKKEEEGVPFIADLEGGYMQPVVYPRKDPFQPRPLPSEFFLREAEDDEYEELALIQMVYPMPVHPTSPEIEPPKSPSDGVDFASLPNGEIAKLQVLDTGEVRLVLGDRGAALDVFQGTPLDHLMEAVRVRQLEDVTPGESGAQAEEEEEGVVRDRRGEMSVLGRIQTRFVCAVNFDDVFDEMAAEREARGHDSDSDTDEAR